MLWCIDNNYLKTGKFRRYRFQKFSWFNHVNTNYSIGKKHNYVWRVLTLLEFDNHVSVASCIIYDIILSKIYICWIIIVIIYNSNLSKGIKFAQDILVFKKFTSTRLSIYYIHLYWKFYHLSLVDNIFKLCISFMIVYKCTIYYIRWILVQWPF